MPKKSQRTKKPEEAKNTNTPSLVRLGAEAESLVAELKNKTGLNKSDIIRRAVRFAGPLFISGAVDVATLQPAAA